MEPLFGYSFGEVRVHTDARAADSARAVDAHAYTVGNHIVFGSRQYSPSTPERTRLLAHELAHVAQQSVAASRSDRISSPGDAGEREAQRAASAVSAGRPVHLQGPASVPVLQRQDAFTAARPDYSIRPSPSLFPGGQVPRFILPPFVLGGAARPLGRRTLPALTSLTFPRSRLLSLATAGLPPNLQLNLSGTSGVGTVPQLSHLFQIPPVPARPAGGPAPVTPGLAGATTLDVGADIALGSQPAFEMSVAMVLQVDAAHFRLGVPIDFIHQPTGTVVLGLSLNPAVAGTAPAYVAAQISTMILNLHLAQLRGHDFLELGLGQLALGVQGGQFQGQAAAQAEFHLTERFSILLTGGITFIPGPDGVTASPGPFNIGAVWHGPGI